MPLEEYKRKRRFDKTPEPSGRTKPRASRKGLEYVIQKHRATALHYDFRLEWKGVLLSWAVPKGPSLDPSVKRLATQVEDHPVEYATFEGIIPADEYGGGTVMVWDRGTWTPESEDVDAGLKKGELKFALHGEKLEGSWVLVRTKGWGGSTKASWLLIKHRDDFASAEDVAESRPRSVVSNRLLTQIALDEGGDVEKASTGDPVPEVEKLLENPKLLERKRKKKPSVWHSNRSNEKSEENPKISSKVNSAEVRPKRSRSSRSASAPPPPSSPSKKSSYSFPVPVSNPDKVFWPEEGWTKGDLVAFYASVFEQLRPWVEDRPLSLERCPDGMGGQCFYQKELPAGMPKGTPTVAVRHGKPRKVTNTVVGGALETQLALANLGCIAIHVWGSRADDLDKPDWVCFDLDPDSGLLADAVKAALKIREALDALKLVSYAKTSGGKGLHVFVPIRRGPDTEAVTAFAKELGTHLAHAWPKELTMEMRIAARKGRVFLDSFRNAFGQTVVSPYSVRRRPHAPVSTPLEWSEVRETLKAEDFTIGNFAQRLKKRDPWADFFRRRQSLGPAIEALKRL